MLDIAIGPGVCGEIDDIESELCSSSREASVGFVAFANLDVEAMRRVGDSRAAREATPRAVADEEGRESDQNRLYRRASRTLATARHDVA